ncbi:GNA1162 family protein [Pseudomonas sp.]|uniref:GNA1162 family protein n=1 Tax=Pseudomonas sp. TaxID=306 RepID=UPI003D0A7662
MVVQYGSTYTLIDSSVKVEAKANLVGLRTGTLLWSGSAFATDQNSNNSGGLVGMLITAAVKQVMNTLTDATYPVAGMASGQLLSAGRVNGILHGPRSPQYGLE